jgi:hypothetical protein
MYSAVLLNMACINELEEINSTAKISSSVHSTGEKSIFTNKHSFLLRLVALVQSKGFMRSLMLAGMQRKGQL